MEVSGLRGIHPVGGVFSVRLGLGCLASSVLPDQLRSGSSDVEHGCRGSYCVGRQSPDKMIGGGPDMRSRYVIGRGGLKRNAVIWLLFLGCT